MKRYTEIIGADSDGNYIYGYVLFYINQLTGTYYRKRTDGWESHCHSTRWTPVHIDKETKSLLKEISYAEVMDMIRHCDREYEQASFWGIAKSHPGIPV